MPIGKEDVEIEEINTKLLSNVSVTKKSNISRFIKSMYTVYVELYFTYMEVNPLVVKQDEIFVLDLAAKIDQTAEYLCSRKWGTIDYPPPFGREAYPEVK